MKRFFKNQPPGRIIALGFAAVILLGALLLSLPCSLRAGESLTPINALYTSTSAVCVTGLVVVDTRTVFTPFGQFVIGLLIQIGGLGVSSVGAGIILAMGRRIDLKGRNLIREAMNHDSGREIVRFLRSILLTTLIAELLGAVLSFPVFRQDFAPLEALGISLFHAVAAFNNAGFDLLGNMENLTPYRGNALLLLTTSALIILGGLGFLVIREVLTNRLHWKKYSFHAKVVLSMTAVLLAGGTVLLKLTEEISWLDAFFHSVSARTAGYSTLSLGTFSDAGLLTMMILMFIGASSGSTGGGVKTGTVFVLVQGIRSAATNRCEKAFCYTIPREAFRKAAVVAGLALGVVLTGTYLLLVLEPQLALRDALVEIVSAVATVGLSTGITPTLGTGAKLLTILLMYMGRLGPLTIASLWYFSRGDRVKYPEGDIAIG